VARRFRHVPVVGPDGQLVGILSDRDLLPAPNGGLAVSELMSSPVWTAAPESPLREVASLMFDRRVGALPILDEGALVGILTRSDILRSLLVEPPLDLWIR
jgi:acetoin utilization protein AcuB